MIYSLGILFLNIQQLDKEQQNEKIGEKIIMFIIAKYCIYIKLNCNYFKRFNDNK